MTIPLEPTAAWAERIRQASAREGEADRQAMAAWLASLPILPPLPRRAGQVLAVFLVRRKRRRP